MSLNNALLLFFKREFFGFLCTVIIGSRIFLQTGIFRRFSLYKSLKSRHREAIIHIETGGGGGGGGARSAPFSFNEPETKGARCLAKTTIVTWIFVQHPSPPPSV